MTKNEIISSESASGPPNAKGAAGSVDLNAIERAVNDAAKRVNSIWLSLIALMTYVFIATGKITHKDLFLEIPVKLPILGVDVPLRGYFIFVPAFVLALHFYFGVQLSGLAEKLREYERTLSEIGFDSGRRNRLRQRLDNSPFAKILSAPAAGLQILLRIVAWASMAVAPPWLILFVQLMYLPQQDVSITYYHKGVLVVDILLVGFYVLPWMIHKNLFFPKQAKSKNLSFQLHRIFNAGGWTDVLMVSIALTAALWIAFLVAIFPWQRTPFQWLTKSWFMVGADPISLGPATWFSNRLILSDLNLIDGIDLTKVNVTRAARNRSFYSATFDRSDLRQTDFTGSDLNFASFNGANLQMAKMGCAYTFHSDSGPSGFGGCTQLREANFNGANMQNASLTGAMMQGASLRNAHANRATLAASQLQGSTLDGASLDAADLTQAGLDGASIKEASLIGADFNSARIRGADFRNSTLFGASIDYVLAQNSSFTGAQLQGASMTWSHFEGANFLAVATYGTDLSSSDFSGARIENVMTEPRWKVGDYYDSTYTPGVSGDPFGKNGDDQPLPDDGGYLYTSPDFESPHFFDEYTSIPASQGDTDRIAGNISEDNEKTNPDDGYLIRRLSRLKPGAATPNWSKLVQKSVSEIDYVNGLGDRLIVIACARPGETSVVRRLVRSQMLCPFRSKINEVLNTNHRPDGTICENTAAIVETLDEWTGCPKPKDNN
jgi:uncharacterized protein YjbI with pentapeptide repeats